MEKESGARFLAFSIFALETGMCLQGLMKFRQCLIKILRKLSIQKPYIFTKGNNFKLLVPSS